MSAALERAARALEPFAEVYRWMERNGHDPADVDFLVRVGDRIAGHAGFTNDDLREAKEAADALATEGDVRP